MKNKLILRANLDTKDTDQFLKIKEAIGLEANAEVIRFVLNRFYQTYVLRKETEPKRVAQVVTA